MTPALRSALACLLALGASLPCAQAISGGSALAALREVSAQPYAATGRIVEMKGRRAAPVPVEWEIILADPSARGGVRVVTVANARITSENTPLHGFTGVPNLPAIDTAKVSIDARTLFQAVQAEAETGRIGFHWLDYTLQTDPATGSPVWSVDLYDHLSQPVASLEVSASTGSLLHPVEFAPGVKPVSEGSRFGGAVGQASENVGGALREAGQSLLRGIGDMQEYLFGERSIGHRSEN